MLSIEENLTEYAKNRALVFEGVDFLFVWKKLMAKKYELLASHLVNINGMFNSTEETIALMRSRIATIS